ncbi:MAG: peptidase M42 [Rhodospirillaceae bacterium]|nr:peptidase M42 [Rhodospirillaceae bacterium]
MNDETIFGSHRGEGGLSDAQFALLQELIFARGPAGVEEEVAVICRRELGKVCDSVWDDATGNVIGLIKAGPRGEGASARPPVIVMAHMDEIALIVKRVYGEGQLRVIKLGGLRPMSFGQVPVDIMGDHGIVPGVLAIGSLHVTKETASLTNTGHVEGDLDWSDMFITTRLSNEQLRERGVHAGSRVVVGPYARRLFCFEDCIAGHFMDDRALLLVGFEAMAALKAARESLARDVYFVCTVKEEVNNAGAHFAAKALAPEEVVALEVGPIAAEYDTKLNHHPIVLYGDMKGFYSKSLADRLKAAAEAEGLQPQLALFENFASDGSAVHSMGNTGRAGTLCIPTQNTHGFEIIHRDAIPACARTLTRYLLS